jgi:cytohesin
MRMTALHVAVVRRNKEMVQLLIQNGADVNAKGYHGRTAMDIAKMVKNNEMVDLLKKHRRNAPTEDDDYGLIPLHHAVVQGDIELVKSLLKEGVSVNSRDNAGRTALHYAAGAKANRHRVSKGNVEVARLLLESSADIDIADKYGWTPLYYSPRLVAYHI